MKTGNEVYPDMPGQMDLYQQPFHPSAKGILTQIARMIIVGGPPQRDICDNSMDIGSEYGELPVSHNRDTGGVKMRLGMLISCHQGMTSYPSYAFMQFY